MDFIKLDVEGAEFLVLKGGANLIDEQKPIIYAELLRKWSKAFGYKPNDVLVWLRDKGYKAYAVAVNGLTEIEKIDEKTVETNFVFFHEKKHEMQISYIGN